MLADGGSRVARRELVDGRRVDEERCGAYRATAGEHLLARECAARAGRDGARRVIRAERRAGAGERRVRSQRCGIWNTAARKDASDDGAGELNDNCLPRIEPREADRVARDADGLRNGVGADCRRCGAENSRACTRDVRIQRIEDVDVIRGRSPAVGDGLLPRDRVACIAARRADESLRRQSDNRLSDGDAHTRRRERRAVDVGHVVHCHRLRQCDGLQQRIRRGGEAVERRGDVGRVVIILTFKKAELVVVNVVDRNDARARRRDVETVEPVLVRHADGAHSEAWRDEVARADRREPRRGVHDEIAQIVEPEIKAPTRGRCGWRAAVDCLRLDARAVRREGDLQHQVVRMRGGVGRARRVVVGNDVVASVVKCRAAVERVGAESAVVLHDSGQPSRDTSEARHRLRREVEAVKILREPVAKNHLPMNVVVSQRVADKSADARGRRQVRNQRRDAARGGVDDFDRVGLRDEDSVAREVRRDRVGEHGSGVVRGAVEDERVERDRHEFRACVVVVIYERAELKEHVRPVAVSVFIRSRGGRDEGVERRVGVGAGSQPGNARSDAAVGDGDRPILQKLQPRWERIAQGKSGGRSLHEPRLDLVANHFANERHCGPETAGLGCGNNRLRELRIVGDAERRVREVRVGALAVGIDFAGWVVSAACGQIAVEPCVGERRHAVDDL